LIFGFFPPGTEVPGGFVLEPHPNPPHRVGLKRKPILKSSPQREILITKKHKSFVFVKTYLKHSLSLPL